ncbi:MAG: RHS repeat-associated core domain-containing protein [Bacteroidales bacterium]|nr:RHS repeat-associated core domain-containing protein [Bacteroidales bacterium]
MKRHSAIFTFPSLAKLAVSLRAWTQLSILRNATPTDVISQYDYTYDAAGRRIEIARSGTAMSESRTDAYGYNVRNELTSATKTGGPASPEYAYQYDDIGNRITSTDLTTNRTYTANSLNQYTLISNLCASVTLCDGFFPQFDDDGNQTLIQTSTGVWSVQYNGENRPVLWTGGTQSATTNIVMSFDRMGRRVEYLETAGGAQSSATETNAYHRFLYDNYLCIQRLDAANGNAVDFAFVWDVTEPIATRPLVLLSGTEPSYYTHDGNKNVSEVVATNGNNAAHYEYALFGAAVAQRGAISLMNPWRFSSEYAEADTVTVYYNHRHYNPTCGTWISRDPIEYVPFAKVCTNWAMINSINTYQFCNNVPLMTFDCLGLFRDCDAEHITCFRLCWNRRPPWPIRKHDGGHYAYCTSKCLAEYMRCQTENACEKITAVMFECIDEAVKWVNENKLAIGTLVVVGGVVYVVSTGGTGALALVPLL